MNQQAKETRKAYYASYRAKNADRLRKYKREWNAANKDKVAAAQERYWIKRASTAPNQT